MIASRGRPGALSSVVRAVARLARIRRSVVRRRFGRVLPLNELLTDRWEKARYLGFGERTSVYDSCLVIGDVRVGHDTWIGPNTILDGSGGLSIGSHCSISAGVQLYSHDSVRWALSGGEAPYEYAPTRIGDNCYIGPNSVVSRGVEIGDNSVVGTNSFVNRSWPPNSKLAGNPARSLE